MKHHYSSSLFLLLGAAAATSASAQALLFQDNFQGWTAGTSLVDNDISPTRWDAADTHNLIEIDTGNVFGGGTSNQFLRLGNQGLAAAPTLLAGGQERIEQRNYGGLATTGVLSVTFDLFEPSNGMGNGLVSDLSERAFFRVRGESEGTGLRTLRIQDGLLRQDGSAGPGENGDTLHDFGLDTVTSFAFIFNQSGADISHNGKTLGSGQVDIYANGVLVVADLLSGKTNATDDFARLYFEMDYATAGTAAQELWIDNWAVFNGAVAIPEPAAMALLLGALGIGFVGLRRRRR